MHRVHRACIEGEEKVEEREKKWIKCTRELLHIAQNVSKYIKSYRWWLTIEHTRWEHSLLSTECIANILSYYCYYLYFLPWRWLLFVRYNIVHRRRGEYVLLSKRHARKGLRSARCRRVEGLPLIFRHVNPCELPAANLPRLTLFFSFLYHFFPLSHTRAPFPK